MTCRIVNETKKHLVNICDAERGRFYIVTSTDEDVLPPVGDLILKTVEGYENLTSECHARGLSHCKNTKVYEVDVEIRILGETRRS